MGPAYKCQVILFFQPHCNLSGDLVHPPHVPSAALISAPRFRCRCSECRYSKQAEPVFDRRCCLLACRFLCAMFRMNDKLEWRIEDKAMRQKELAQGTIRKPVGSECI